MGGRKSLTRMVDRIVEGFDYIYNDTLITAASFVVNLFTITASGYYALTGAMPVIPQWAWVCVFVFMLTVGTFSLQDLVSIGYDEHGNKLPDEEEEELEEPEDDEIAPD